MSDPLVLLVHVFEPERFGLKSTSKSSTVHTLVLKNPKAGVGRLQALVTEGGQEESPCTFLSPAPLFFQSVVGKFCLP